MFNSVVLTCHVEDNYTSNVIHYSECLPYELTLLHCAVVGMMMYIALQWWVTKPISLYQTTLALTFCPNVLG